MDKLFYENGLRFTCKRCSQCCRHSPGYVFLTRKDLIEISKACKISPKDVIDKYCKLVDLNIVKRVSLIEKLNYDCIFWGTEGCEIYMHRPLQCRSFPFWITNLECEQAWDNLKSSCPGAGQGELHPPRTIQYWLTQRQKEGFLTDKDIYNI